MTKRKTLKQWIEMKNAEQIFPDKIRVLRHHDFLNLRVKKAHLLNKKEKEMFEDIADFSYRDLDASDLYVKRIKKKINIGVL